MRLTTKRRFRGSETQSVFFTWQEPVRLSSDGRYIICTRTFLSLANLELHFLTIIQRSVIIATSNFRMMHEKVLASVFWSNETVTFSCVEPLNCTYTHTCTSLSCNGELGCKSQIRIHRFEFEMEYFDGLT
jgi:hypothetical protein